MKFLVLSDSHGSINNMLNTVDYEAPDVILHLGDYMSDCDSMIKMYPQILLRSVRGNSDGRFPGLDVDEFVMEGKRFMLTHGHLFGVKMGKSKIINAAKDRSIDILLFGHTHSQYHSTDGNITILNPGSIHASTREYAVLEIKNGIIEHEFKRV